MKHQEFISLFSECRKTAYKYLGSKQNNDSDIRYQQIIDYCGQSIEFIKSNMIANDLTYLEIIRMIEKDDPQDLIRCVLAVNGFYVKHYKAT